MISKLYIFRYINCIHEKVYEVIHDPHDKENVRIFLDFTYFISHQTSTYKEVLFLTSFSWLKLLICLPILQPDMYWMVTQWDASPDNPIPGPWQSSSNSIDSAYPPSFLAFPLPPFSDRARKFKEWRGWRNRERERERGAESEYLPLHL